MARGGGETHAGRAAFTRAQRAEISRMARRIRSLRAQLPALEQTMADYGEDFDLIAWTDVFTSGNPDDVNRSFQLIGVFNALVNNLVELLRSGTLTAGLVSGKRPRAETVFETVKNDKGVSASQAELLEQLYVLRGRLQHASPDVTAKEVHEYAFVLVEQFPGMFDATITWLARHGIDLG